MTTEEIKSWREGVERLQAVLNVQSERRSKPNFFRIAPRLLRKEGVHSDLLAWLLDPHGWHGLGDTFGRHFIGEALAAAGCPLSGPFAVTRVQTEFSTGEGPIDVLVNMTSGDTSLVVGIENKIDAAVGPAQLLRDARGLVIRADGTRPLHADHSLRGFMPPAAAPLRGGATR